MLIKAHPSPLVINHGSFELPDDVEWRPVLEAARSRLESVLESVGRLECPELGARSQCGTAWLVHRDIVVTNRHTVMTHLAGIHRGDKTLRVDFHAELNAMTDRRVSVRRVLYVSPDHDIAFLQLDGFMSRRSEINLADKIVPHHPIAVIGFPSDESSGYDVEVFQRCFKEGFDQAGRGVKRISLGRIEAVTACTIEHDCTTLGGSSGSVILDLVTGRAIGLNYGSEDTRERIRPTNLGVPAWIILERIARLNR